MGSKFYLGILTFMVLTVPALASSKTPVDLCKKPLSDSDLVKVFRQNVLKQLALEFGDRGLFVYDIEHQSVDGVVSRFEAYAKYPRPGQTDLATMRLKAWVSRCEGTTIVRGNTWLADGTLVVPRYSETELKGKGLRWGDPNAPQRFIVYLDSRCPHCHRLISYAKKLVESGKVFLDIRQVAYLENIDEALTDTRLSETSLVINGNSKISDDEYLDMVGGFPNEIEIELKGAAHKKAVQILQLNTEVAREVLHIITVPAVLVREPQADNQYRQMGYWELNRIFQ